MGPEAGRDVLGYFQGTVCCVFFFSLLCLESVWPGLQEKARKRGDKEFFRAREDFFAEKVTWSECLPNAEIFALMLTSRIAVGV